MDVWLGSLPFDITWFALPDMTALTVFFAPSWGLGTDRDARCFAMSHCRDTMDFSH